MTVSTSPFHDLPVPVVLVTREWRVISVNPPAAERLGAKADHVGGLALSTFFELGDAAADRLREAANTGPRALVQSLRIRRDDRPIVVDALINAAHAGDSRALQTNDAAWIIVFLDAESRLAQQEELARLQRALAESEKARSKMNVLTQELASGDAAPRIIGASAPILRMLEQVDRVAPTDATVLIHGESGSGKELVARAIHAQSRRSTRPLVAVNCAAMPESLIESQLFGHERGAFTGADRQRLGKFELADTGTLFLDEVAELSMQAQAKLLRVIQEGALERVGGSETIRVDVRLVAATHRELAEQVRRGRFREDLFYRLNVFRIDVPSLRDRREDIRALVEHFHEKHAKRMARPILPLSERAMRLLLSYRWPGNVRELENTVERATLLASGPELDIELPQSPVIPDAARPGSSSGGGSASSAPRDPASIPRDVLLDLSLDQLQRLQIMHALETRGYRVFGKDGAAEKLGLNPQTLLSRMVKLGIPRPRAMRKALKGDRAE
ncbi:MAG TPA: sigma 54-interacting transcriptional regulator [Phycisphaerales bacterium]|nr:sigma 54-interacting transcriptional regulator [Phycisphaerales bacterium]